MQRYDKSKISRTILVILLNIWRTRYAKLEKKDDKVDCILNQLHEKDLKTPDLGLRAFSWDIEKMI